MRTLFSHIAMGAHLVGTEPFVIYYTWRLRRQMKKGRL